MASPVLHIKDAYYFEVPKALWPSARRSKVDFPDVWVKLDPEFQLWEAERLHAGLAQVADDVPDWPALRHQYVAWQSDHANFGKPLGEMLNEAYETAAKSYGQLVRAEQANPIAATTSFREYLEESQPPCAWFLDWRNKNDAKWSEIRQEAGDVVAYQNLPGDWASAKIDAYNERLAGKVLIPQPFGKLRNLHEPDSGFCISKFLIVEVAVALILLAVFTWLGRKVREGGPPRGRLWNLLEVFLVRLRDNVARNAIGEHDGDRFVPLLWTIFMFVLVCNLCGMIPWLGTPTCSLSVTTALAAVTFLTTCLSGMLRFGVVGFFANQVPSMTLPLVMAIFIKPLVLVLELFGLCVKHGVLSVRLLANMVAGHLVLLAILGLAFGATGAASFAHLPAWLWGGTAVVSIGASTLLSCLELFVAFLQAYIFTFLSALFIGAAVHHH